MFEMDDDIMNKRPSFQFYPADWIKDPDLQMCSMSTIGIWINLLCRMWESKNEGILSGTIEQLALLTGAKKAEFNQFLKDAKLHNFCDVLHDVTKCNGNVTVKCRRMNKLFRGREGAKERMKRHRNGNVTPNVTTHSSSSSSSSLEELKEKSIKEKKITPHKKKFLEFVYLTGDEYKKLVENFGEFKTADYIERLNNGIGSKGYKYKSHYHTILSWSRKDANVGTKAAKSAGNPQRNAPKRSTEHRDGHSGNGQYIR